MSKGFTPITAERYPEGYLEAFAKGGNTGGKIILVCGAIMTAIGLLIGFGLIKFLTQAQSQGYNDTTGVAVFGIFCLFFLVPGVLLIRTGYKRKKMGADAWLQKMVNVSSYPESIVRDFASQVPQQDSFWFDLTGKSTNVGILTRDYILFENALKPCIIKRSDIIGAYLVNLPDSVNAGNKIKTVYRLNIVIFSNHNTYIITEASQDEAGQLIAMLTEKHPDIDTADGRIISDKEYDKMRMGAK